jgi:hypothetical protein
MDMKYASRTAACSVRRTCLWRKPKFTRATVVLAWLIVGGFAVLFDPVDDGVEVANERLSAFKLASSSTDSIAYPCVHVLGGTGEWPREDISGHITAGYHVVMHKLMPFVRETSAASKLT